MGFIDTSTDKNLPVFYNVVHAVGKNCPNLRDDVKLVQYLLKSIYDKYPPQYRPNGTMTVDGVCGAITLNWILKFQLDANESKPGKVNMDGRVDRARSKTLYGSIGNTAYTIGLLNINSADLNSEAWLALPGLIPLENIANVPPPSPDIVGQMSKPTSVPTVAGGF